MHKNCSARDTCLCKTHANFSFIFEKLRQHEIVTEKNASSFVKNVVCDVNSKECMFGECLNCKNRSIFREYPAEHLTFYYLWVTEKVVRPGAKKLDYTVQITSRKTIECSYADLVEACKKMLPNYLKHCFITRHQFQALQEIKDNLKRDEILINLDFSQNYSCKYGSEIQSIHFGASKRQVTLHTGGFYYRDQNEEVSFQSFATFSDCLNHEASAVWAHL